MKAQFDWRKYSVAVWCVSLIGVVLSYWVRPVLYACIPLAVAVFVSFGYWLMTLLKEKDRMRGVFSGIPTKYMLLLLLTVLYAGINFFVCLYLLRDGGPHIANGVYCLWNHGFVREITKAEYDALCLVAARQITGHLAVFSFLPVLVSRKK